MCYTRIVVSNICRVISFYQVVFRFEIIKVFQMNAVELNLIFNEKWVRVIVAYLNKEENKNSPSLELIEFIA